MLKVTNLCKAYPSFKLDNISFELPKGYIMGFLGMNGAGKTTTLKCLLDITHADSGSIDFFGKNLYENEVEIKQNVGLLLGGFDYYPKAKLKDITQIYSSFFNSWNNEQYTKYINKFNLDIEKRVTELSAGMKVKFGLTLALSHNAKLLILDEPTSGLDPIARSELLDIFRDIIEDEETSILFSTHITSDLDKCADFIVILKNGKVLANSTKDDLINNHILISGEKELLTDELKSKMIAYKVNKLSFKGLIEKTKLNKTDNLIEEKPNLEDIMIYFNMEARKWVIL